MRHLDPKKGLFTIGVAAEIVGVEPRVLRFYEKHGLLQPRRTDGNRRLYSIEELELLEYVHYLTQVKRVNLPGVKVVLELLAKLPPEVRARELASGQRAIEQLDTTSKELFSRGAVAVAPSLLEEQTQGVLPERTASEVERPAVISASSPDDE